MTDTTIIARPDVAASNPVATTAVPAWLSPGAITGTTTTGAGKESMLCGACHQRVLCLCRQRELEADARREAGVWYILAAGALVAISYALLQYLASF